MRIGLYKRAGARGANFNREVEPFKMEPILPTRRANVDQSTLRTFALVGAYLFIVYCLCRLFVL